MKKFRSSFLIIGFLLVLNTSFLNRTVAQDTLKVMYYNVLNFPGSTGYRVSYFRTINQYISPDILLVTELHDNNGAITLLQEGLNVYGTTHYAQAIFTDGPDSDNMLYYNSDKLGLCSQDTIHTTLRLINEYVLYYKHPDLALVEDTTFFYFYVAHLKASSGSTNEQKRLAEVLKYKNHINFHPEAENVFFGGDLNMYDSYEPAYQSLINDGIYPLNDPLPAGNWHDEQEFAHIHTQSTRTAQFGGGATGGLDDRFDFILFSDDVLSGINQVTYVNNSCYAMGNDGNHLNKSILASPPITLVPDSVLQALYYMSDHLPVICELAVEVPEVQRFSYLDLKVYLEGPYNGTDMNTHLSGQPGSIEGFPFSQPYNQPPWNYSGEETIETSLSENIVDWILVELRETTGNASTALPDSIIWQQACLLSNEGEIVNADQSTMPSFELDVDNNLYVVLHHRNHLNIMSAFPANLNDSIYHYDFTLNSSLIYGGTEGISYLGNNAWGMSAGDGNSDGIINISDKTEIWIPHSGKAGYYNGDFNLDGEVNLKDLNDFWFFHLEKQSQVPE